MRLLGSQLLKIMRGIQGIHRLWKVKLNLLGSQVDTSIHLCLHRLTLSSLTKARNLRLDLTLRLQEIKIP